MQKDKKREELAINALNNWLLNINENGYKDIDNQIQAAKGSLFRNTKKDTDAIQ